MTNSRKGVTLIELIIAVTLLSLLSVGILMALRVGLNGLDRANAKLIANRKAVSVQRILRSQLSGFMPVTADCRADASGAPRKVPFFEGGPQTMRFVSSYSLGEASRGLPRILEFQIVTGEEGLRLVVNELLYTGPLSAGAACIGIVPDPATGMPRARFRQVEAGPASFVLADRLAYCRFAYRELAKPPVGERWVSEWIQTGRWPSAVRVELAPLKPDPSHVPLVPVTVPFAVNRIPIVSYVQ